MNEKKRILAAIFTLERPEYRHAGSKLSKRYVSNFLNKMNGKKRIVVPYSHWNDGSTDTGGSSRHIHQYHIDWWYLLYFSIANVDILSTKLYSLCFSSDHI